MSKIYELRISYRADKKLNIGGIEWDIDKETPKVIYISKSGAYKNKVKVSELGVIEKNFGSTISSFRFSCWCRKETFERDRVILKERFFEFINEAKKDLAIVLAGISQHGWDITAKDEKNV